VTALEHADRANPQDVAGFMPSLLASIGRCHFDRHDHAEALRWYERAESRLSDLDATPYGDRVREGIESHLATLRA
jgi:hypothetical protein